MALWFASATPVAVWRSLAGVVLGLAAPVAGLVAYLRGDRADESPGERIGRVEWVMVGVGLSLIVPTIYLAVLQGGFY